MTAAPSPDSNEPPPPQRGMTREERGRDVSGAQAEAEAETSTGKRILKSMSLPFVLSQADGYPVVLKQFIQFCLILIYPAWVFAVLVGGAIYGVFYSVLWVLFWPVRAWMKKNRPEEYEASRQKFAKK
jgi:YggT family protein